MSVFICPQCGIEFRDSRHKNRTYCSHACAYAAQKKRTKLTCLQCGKQFTVLRYKAKTQRFCSQTCANRYNQPKDPTKRSIFTCEWCSQPFEEWIYRQPRFCSNQCRSEFAARQPKPKARKPESYIEFKCEWCGQHFKVHKSIVNNPKRTSRFCSKNCLYNAMSQERRGKNNPNYNGGHVDHYGPNWERQKRKAQRRDDNTCQVCGYHVGGDKILDVHHITPFKTLNGDWQYANRLENLICLCRDCHVQVEHNKIPLPMEY